MTLALIPLGVSGQTADDFMKAPQNHYPVYAIGVNSGTAGWFGFDFQFQFSKHFGFSANYHHLKVSVANLTVNASNFGFTDQSLLMHADMNLSTAGLNLEVMPFRKPWFRLVAGAALGLNNEILTRITFDEEMMLNDFVIEPERIGSITGRYQSAGTILPYVGIGLGRGVPKRRVGVGLELGAFYRGAPKIDLLSDGLLSDNEHNGPVLEENLQQIQWHPKIAVRLAVRLGRIPGKFQDPDENPLLNTPAIESIATVKEQKEADRADHLEPIVEDYIYLKGEVSASHLDGLVDHLYLRAYKIDDYGQEELVRADRFIGGTFSISLKRGAVYKIVLEHIDYQKIEALLQVDDQTVPHLNKSFTFSPQ